MLHPYRGMTPVHACTSIMVYVREVRFVLSCGAGRLLLLLGDTVIHGAVKDTRCVIQIQARSTQACIWNVYVGRKRGLIFLHDTIYFFYRKRI